MRSTSTRWIKDYVVDVVHATREPETYRIAVGRLIEYGASPRATIGLTLGAKACRSCKGRAYVTPQDVKSIGMDVLRHRVIASYEAEARQIFDHVPVP
jgi:MoxR-like ATPase